MQRDIGTSPTSQQPEKIDQDGDRLIERRLFMHSMPRALPLDEVHLSAPIPMSLIDDVLFPTG